jgi:hypothetical protein
VRDLTRRSIDLAAGPSRVLTFVAIRVELRELPAGDFAFLDAIARRNRY